LKKQHISKAVTFLDSLDKTSIVQDELALLHQLFVDKQISRREYLNSVYAFEQQLEMVTNTPEGDDAAKCKTCKDKLQCACGFCFFEYSRMFLLL